MDNFYLPKAVTAKANACLNSKIIKEFFHNFSFTASELTVVNASGFIFSVDTAKKIEDNNYEYVINVEKTGVFVSAKGKAELIRGVLTLFNLIKMDYNGNAYIECGVYKENPLLEVRMAHFCVFHDTKLYQLERFIRFVGALKYTHVIVEFWGMLKFDVLKELAWENAYKKEEIRPIFKIANDLGVEVIPMFNHWGHASASRVKHGKHVVLNQNPALQYYFSNDGWCWNYKNPKTQELHAKIRQELIELCGEGSYFHIGCDEAYGFDFSIESMTEFCSYVNELSAELNKTGRKAIVWGDMFVAKHEDFNKNNVYTVNSKSLETEEFFLNNLDKNICIADWQYCSPEYPIQTSYIFKNAGFDTLICPFDVGVNQVKACINTAKDGFSGIIHTTWHTLSTGYPLLYLSGKLCYSYNAPNHVVECANLLRKCYFVDGDYEKSGWSEKEIFPRTN